MARHSNLEDLKVLHKTVAAAGTAEVLAANHAIPAGIAIVIKAFASNTNNIYVGGTKAAAESSTLRFTLDAGEAISVQVTDLNKVWIDADTNDEGVEILFETNVAQ